MRRAVIPCHTAIEWGVASRAMAGESIPGDLSVVKAFDRGVLLAAVDGVGHGSEATAAARLAADVLERYAGESVICLVKRCHSALLQTRGVALTVASVDTRESALTWIGVGNVEGLLLRADQPAIKPVESVLLRAGLVGYRLPALQASMVPLVAGDLLVFATDGVSNRFGQDITFDEPPEGLAQRLLMLHSKRTDDALVLVARYRGDAP